MTRLIRTELFKIRTVRLTFGLLAAAVALTAFHSILIASRAGTGGAGPGGDVVAPLDTAAGLTAVLTTTGFALMLALVFGVTVSSGEFRHDTATGTYLDTPRRDRVLAAKMVAGAAWGLVMGLAAAVTATGIGLAIVATKGDAVALPVATIVRFALGATVGAGLLAAVGVAVGSLIRQQLGAIVGVFVWGVLVEQVVDGLFPSVAPYLPFSAAISMAGLSIGTSPLPFAAAAALVAATALASSAVALGTTVQRDVT